MLICAIPLARAATVNVTFDSPTIEFAADGGIDHVMNFEVRQVGINFQPRAGIIFDLSLGLEFLSGNTNLGLSGVALVMAGNPYAYRDNGHPLYFAGTGDSLFGSLRFSNNLFGAATVLTPGTTRVTLSAEVAGDWDPVGTNLAFTSGSALLASGANHMDVTVTNLLLTGTTTTLISSTNPTTYGSNVTFTATVSPGAATGTVTFKDGTSTLGTGTLSGGVATFATSSLALGSHTITAEYAGDSGYLGSTNSPALAQTVNPASA
ncbi:MAG: Ig-like domain-containing protein, partial [Verrucomicrobiota bacterium]